MVMEEKMAKKKEVWSGNKRSFASGWLKFIGSIIHR